MLEYFTIKKVRKHRAEKAAAEKERLEKEAKEDAPAAAAGSTAKTNEDAPTTTTIISEPRGGGEARTPTPKQVDVPAPVLKEEDEKFLERFASSSSSAGVNPDTNNKGDDETPPPLPPRVKTPVIEWDSDASSVGARERAGVTGDGSKKDKDQPKEEDKGKGKGKDRSKGKEKGKTTDGNEKPDNTANQQHQHKPNRFSFVTNIGRTISLRKKPGGDGAGAASPSTLKPSSAAAAAATPADAEAEVRREEAEVARVLEDLNLAAARVSSKDGGEDDSKAFSLSRETTEVLGRFTQVLRDLAAGVPTAYGDLASLVEDRDGVIERAYNRLPRGLKKLVAQLPDQLSSKLAPELLAVAAEAQGLSTAEAEGGNGGGIKGAAKRFLTPSNLQELVTKPGALATLLKGIVNALKTRWPAFIGTNVLWSVAVFRES